MTELQLQFFGGTVTSLTPESISATAAQDSLNAAHQDGSLAFRRGFKNLRSAQGGFTASYGFFYCQGYNSSNTEVDEYVSFENLGGGVTAYSNNASTLAATAITGATTLHASDWASVNFNASTYFINSNHTTNVCRHAVGDATSWVNLAIPADPATALTYRIDLASGGSAQYATLSWAGTDPADVTVTGNARTTNLAPDTSGNLVLQHENDQADGSFEVDLSAITAGVQDWSYNDCFAFTMTPVTPASFALDPTSIKVTFTNNDGSPKTFIPNKLEAVEISAGIIGAANNPPQGVNPVYAIRIQFDNKTRTDWDNVKKIKVAYRYVRASETQANNKLRVSKITVGCCIFAKASNPFGSGSADSSATKDVMRFGYAQYASTIGGGLMSGVAGVVDIPLDYLQGQSPYKGLDPLGVWVTFTLPGASADANVDNYRLFWQDDDAKWRLIATQADGTATYALKISYQELLALTQYRPGPFKTSNCVNAFVFKESVCWLYGEGISNIRYSRINDAEKQSSVYDEVDDETRGATFTLADYFGDSPLAGVQAGDSAILGGNTGIYEQTGAIPSDMSPPKRFSQGHGLASKFALCRWRDDYGNAGACYVDKHGQSVWFVLPSGSGNRDEEGKIIDLMPSLRGKIRKFLLQDQSGLGLTDFSTLRIWVDEAQDSLFIGMGRRLMKLPPANPASGNREWEFYELNTGSSTVTVKNVAPSSKRRVRWMRSDGKIDENEWNTADSCWIEGSLIDAGNKAPNGFWESKDMDGDNRRIFQFYCEKKPDYKPIRIRWSSERLIQTYKLAAQKHFMRCHMLQQGRRHKFRIILEEDSPKITRFFWHEIRLGARWQR